MIRDLSSINRIVIKIGTNILTQGGTNIDISFLNNLAEQVSYLYQQNKQILIVTSGAIKCGKERVKISPKNISDKQAAAAIGQPYLMQHYIDAFKKFNISVAQALLTREDIAERARYLNARNTFYSLFKYGVVPIVNENDTVSTEEIKEMRFGDNDTLSALVASLIGADLLIILSDVEGLYDCDPKKKENAILIKEVNKITDKISQNAGGRGTDDAVGGMRTKIVAAKIAASAGIYVVIASGFKKNVILDITKGKKIGTLFHPSKNILSSRKCWIAFCKNISGKVYVNEGAKNMIKKHNKSLLPVGVIKIEGCFAPGDNVSVVDTDGNDFARGITNYSSDDIKKIAGAASYNIQDALGYYRGDEIIQRDNLVIWEGT